MARTRRASYPAAARRDRSISRKGVDPSIRKNGAGSHNWGDVKDEWALEALALEDEQRELAEEGRAPGVSPFDPVESEIAPKMLTDEDQENAVKSRKHALKKIDSGAELDLATTARTSSAGSLPTFPARISPAVTSNLSADFYKSR